LERSICNCTPSRAPHHDDHLLREIEKLKAENNKTRGAKGSAAAHRGARSRARNATAFGRMPTTETPCVKRDIPFPAPTPSALIVDGHDFI
jgi:hypothetical protein